MAQKELWPMAKQRLLEDPGALPEEDGHQLREYESMRMVFFFLAVGRVMMWNKKAEMGRSYEEAKSGGKQQR